MTKFTALTLVVLLFAVDLYATGDSVIVEKKPAKSHSTLTVRTHTMGYFSFTGRIISPNPALDFFYTYDRKQWGFSAFKAFDLYDHNSSNNFMLLMVRKTFHVGKRLTITPHVGFILEESNSVADLGSDVSTIIITAYKVSSHVTVDYTAIFGNLAIVPEERDWFNRFRILYTNGHWDATALFYHNNNLIDNDNSEYYSVGLNLFYSRIKMNDHLLFNVGVSGLKMPCSTNPTDYPKREGVFFTLAAYIH